MESCHVISSVQTLGSSVRTLGRDLAVLLISGIVLVGAADSVAAQGWVITGQVVDDQGIGVADMDIDIIDNSPIGNGSELSLSQDITGADGMFTLTILAAIPIGNFYEFRFNPPPGAPYFPAMLTDVFLGGNTNLAPIALETAWTLSGSVVDEQGLPLAEVDLDFIDDSGVPYVASGDFTDGTGAYSVILPPGVWTIDYGATAATGVGPYVPARLENIQLDLDVTLADVVLRIGYPVSGVVQTAGGSAVVGADLDVVDPITDLALPLGGDSTDGSGQVQVLIPAGDWLVEVQPPAGPPLVAQVFPITVSHPGLDLGVITLPVGVVVSGATLDNQLVPVPDVDLDFIQSATQLEIVVAQDNANGSGQFAPVVPPDTYDIAFRPLFTTGLAPVLLPDVDASSDIDLGSVVLPPGHVLSGQVTAAGVPVADVELSLVDSTTGDAVYTFGDESDSIGAYAVRVASGTYDIIYTPSPSTGLASALHLAVIISADTELDADLGPGIPPVGGLVCLATGSNVQLDWVNGATDYDAIRVIRSGATVASLGGTATSYSELGLPDGPYDYEVVAVRGGADAPPAGCAIDVSTGGGADFIRGNANGDLGVNVGDAISILDGLFGGVPFGCLDAADVNDDGTVNIGDPIFLLAYLFAGGPSPPSPFPIAGPDPTADPLICP